MCVLLHNRARTQNCEPVGSPPADYLYLLFLRSITIYKKNNSIYYQILAKSYMSNIIYIISNCANVRDSRYKVGKHKGDQRKLINRYKTALIDPTIYLFYPCSDASQMETAILTELDQYRVVDAGGKKTEWVQAPLLLIISTAVPILSSTKDSQPAAKRSEADLVEEILALLHSC